jgi:hypothetical protein
VLRGHLETWVYDAGANTWTRTKPPREPDGQGNRRRIMVAVPDQNVILMEDYINPTERVPGVDREQQMWTYRYAVPKADDRPATPTGLTLVTKADSAVLKWKPVEGAVKYAVHRGEDKLPRGVEFRRAGEVEKGSAQFEDAGLRAGTVYYYVVRSVDAQGRESADSVRVRTQPKPVEDVVVSAMSATEVHLTWPAAGPDVVAYRVERAAVEVFTEDQLVRLKKDTPPLAEPSVGAVKAIGPFRRITRLAVQGQSFTDRTIDLSKPVAVEGETTFKHRFAKEQIEAAGKPYRYAVYAYRVRAVNELGVEGGPGPYALTIPGSPQDLFAKEDGERCHLKWAASPEPGVTEYRVYRMEGPRVNGPGQKVTRLTADPVRETTFTDPKAGKDTRRYWVVAVDALGQEGIPSAPAWHYRQYRKYYEPFVGEWHQ